MTSLESAQITREWTASPTSGAIFYPILQDSVIFAAELLQKLYVRPNLPRFVPALRFPFPLEARQRAQGFSRGGLGGFLNISNEITQRLISPSHI